MARVLISPDLKCHNSLQPLADVLGEATPSPRLRRVSMQGITKSKRDKLDFPFYLIFAVLIKNFFRVLPGLNLDFQDPQA